MISLTNIITIFKKEFLQTMRNKSVLFSNYFMPLFAIPLYIILMTEGTIYLTEKKKKPLTDDTTFHVNLIGDINKEVLSQLQNDPKLDLLQSTVTSDKSYGLLLNHIANEQKVNELAKNHRSFKDNIKLEKSERKTLHNLYLQSKAQYQKSQVRLKDEYLLKGDITLASIKQSDHTYVFYTIYDEEREQSKAALEYLSERLSRIKEKIIQQTKSQKSISPADLNPLTVKDLNISHKRQWKNAHKAGFMAGCGIIFYLLLVMFAPAINTTIGEREEKTYKILLMNPVKPLEIYLGKYLNVALQSVLTIIPFIIEFIIFYAWGENYYLFTTLKAPTIVSFILFIILTASVAVFLTSVCFLVCCFANTRVQAQSTYALLFFIIFGPLTMVMLTKYDLSLATSFIPLINYPLALDSLLMISSSNHLGYYFIATLINVTFSLVLIYYSLDVFINQWSGSSDHKNLSDLLTFKRRQTKTLIPAHSFLAFIMAYLGYTYIGNILTVFSVEIVSLVFTPILFGLGTGIFILSYSKLDFTKDILWKRISSVDVLLITFLAAIMSGLSNYIMSLIGPSFISTILAKLLEDFFSNPSFLSYFSLFLIVALIPSICEEFLFRGIIYKGLKNQYRFLVAAVLSSFLFSIVHFSTLNLIYLMPLGLVLCYLYEKKGLLASILLHLVFNTSSLIIAIYFS